VFLWGFGGLYLKDRQSTEFELLERFTGVPAAHIPDALKPFDILFPIGNGTSWLATPGPTSVTRVKMMPFAFHGLGAFLRMRHYSVSTYYDLGYTDYTADDLSRRHNALIELLSRT
jgi:hypothetical protein